MDEHLCLLFKHFLIGKSGYISTMPKQRAHQSPHDVYNRHQHASKKKSKKQMPYIQESQVASTDWNIYKGVKTTIRQEKWTKKTQFRTSQNLSELNMSAFSQSLFPK